MLRRSSTISMMALTLFSIFSACTLFKPTTHNGDYKVEPADQTRFDADYNICGNRASLNGAQGEGALYDAEVRLGSINRCLDEKGWKR